MAKRRAMQATNSVDNAASGLQEFIDSAEDLLEGLQDQQGVAVERLRAKVSATISSARERLADTDVSEMASEAYDNTVGFIRQDRWRAVAVGALAILAASPANPSRLGRLTVAFANCGGTVAGHPTLP
jgi:ElaB/YqjD/DUF883 family membrane-anchored ribosome-binding protein